MNYTVAEFLGDGISAELAQAVRGVAACLPFSLDFETVDLSLPNRTARGMAIYDEAVAAIERHRFCIKYPTTTATESPNALLRQRCDFSVIHRPVATIPGVPTNFRQEFAIQIVRVATGGTYDDPGRAIGTEAAVSLRIVERRPCWEAANFAFQLAKRLGKTVCSSSKHTIQAATDGLFETIVDDVARDYPEVEHLEELFDSLLAKLIMTPNKFSVILVLNEYGDFLSDMACGLAGSMGIGASASLSFTRKGEVRLGMFDPAGGTAPDIAGKNLVNPTAIFLALGMLLHQLGENTAATALETSTYDLLKRGERTRDLGGKLSTTEFTAAVVQEMARRINP
jgi:isocitrate dehydrogenase (NAD+)